MNTNKKSSSHLLLEGIDAPKDTKNKRLYETLLSLREYRVRKSEVELHKAKKGLKTAIDNYDKEYIAYQDNNRIYLENCIELDKKYYERIMTINTIKELRNTEHQEYLDEESRKQTLHDAHSKIQENEENIEYCKNQYIKKNQSLMKIQHLSEEERQNDND